MRAARLLVVLAARASRASSASRMRRRRACSPATTSSRPSARRSGSSRCLLVRLFRSLDALWGHEEAAHRGSRADNLALAARPVDLLAVRRRPRSCRQLPGQRARSPLAPLPLRHALWRAVEAQHVVSTMALVDSLEEQHVLERLLDDTSPPIPAAAAHLHWLLFTPFRYPPPPGGSRFRGPNDPGVFYGADEIRTACAELGYWRWRHLLDSPALHAMPTQAADGVPGEDRRPTRSTFARTPFVARSRALDRPGATTRAARRFGRTAREAGVGADPLRIGPRSASTTACCAVLSPAAFAPPIPLEQQTWMLSVAPRSRHLAAHARARRRRARVRPAGWRRKPSAAVTADDRASAR